MKAKQIKRTKIQTITAAVLWIASFVFSFALPARGSYYKWLPDALLLVGFFPLLYAYRAGWAWLVFGILNSAIGFVLEVSYHMPAEAFSIRINQARNLLMSHHSSLTWIIIGFFCTIFGVIKIAWEGLKCIHRFINKADNMLEK